MQDIKTIEFIKKANKQHGNKYNYSKVQYINSITKVTIICKKHGDFEQQPSNHLFGKKCHECANTKSNNKEFIEKANKKHNNK